MMEDTRMRRTGWILVSCCLAVLGVVISAGAGRALAQSQPDAPPAGPGGPGGPGPGFGIRGFPPGRGSFGFGIEGCLNSGKVVSGEGYVGTLTDEKVKPVLNGAPIDH